MAEPTNGGGNGAGAPTPMQVRVLGQYIKDMSFENPNIHKLISSAPEEPTLKLEINVAPNQLGADLFEAAITFKAEATAKLGTIYVLEMIYAGLFRIENAPPGVLEPMLHVNCPALLFPFLRRIVCDITREGGFPPLLLDPVDFGALLMKKRETSGTGAPPAGATR